MDSVRECTIDRHTNTNDYYAELATIVSSLFGIDVEIQLHGVCLVTNRLLPTTLDTQIPFCAAVVNSSTGSNGGGLLREFFSTNSVGYTETCVFCTTIAVAAHFDHVSDPHLDLAYTAQLGRTLAFDRQPGLIIAMQVTVHVHNAAAKPEDLVRFFSNLYAPKRVFVNSSQLPAPASSKGIFSLHNDGMSGGEKSGCALVSPLFAPIACAQNLSVSQSHGHGNTGAAACVQFAALNDRVDVAMLKRFIVAKPTSNTVQARGISIYNQLDAYIDSIPCTGGVSSLVRALTHTNSESTYFDIESKHQTKLTLVVQHVLPFMHIPDYLHNILRLLREDEMRPQQQHIYTTAVLHMYTKGVAYGTAVAFFETMMREYIVSRLQHETDMQLKISKIQLIVQYSPTFPNTLFEKDEDLVQL